MSGEQDVVPRDYVLEWVRELQAGKTKIKCQLDQLAAEDGIREEAFYKVWNTWHVRQQQSDLGREFFSSWDHGVRLRQAARESLEEQLRDVDAKLRRVIRQVREGAN